MIGIKYVMEFMLYDDSAWDNITLTHQLIHDFSTVIASGIAASGTKASIF